MVDGVIESSGESATRKTLQRLNVEILMNAEKIVVVYGR
jgi:hypothetical protein